MRSLLALAVLLAAAPALAQSPDPAPGALSAAAADVAGTYAASDASLSLTASGSVLLVEPDGQAAIDALSAQAGDARFSHRAERLLTSALAGDLGPLRAAAPEGLRDRAARDFGRCLRTFADAYGPAESVAILGTTPDRAGRAVTVARVQFERGEETVRMVWRNGFLTLLTRGPAPRYVAQPVRGEAVRYAVLDAGEPVALLTFRDDRLQVRHAEGTLHARRSR